MLKQKRPMWEGPTAKLVERIYACNSPASVFVTKARVIVHAAKQTRPPIDPFALAASLNVRVEEKPMALDGFIEKDCSGQFVVVLNKDTGIQRKRFTLCHELAHTFFFDDLVHSRSFRRENQYDPEEERLCNLAAAEMLMPFRMFNGDLQRIKDKNGITPDTVFKLMDRYVVSLQAASNRITWIVRGSACVIWRRDGTAINLEWATPMAMRDLVLCQTGRTSVERACSRPGQVFSAPDSYYTADQRRIRRWTISRKMLSGSIFSVLTCQDSAKMGESNLESSFEDSCLSAKPTEEKSSRGRQDPHQIRLSFD